MCYSATITTVKKNSGKSFTCRDGAIKSKGNKERMKTQKKTNLIQEGGEEIQEEYATCIPLTIKCVERM